ncbi:MAG: ATP-dependent DNA helicase RecG [Eubacteriales bacterium]|nr:ATP-dependent DNA helicase RecG [Eubacteriales bacterium]
MRIEDSVNSIKGVGPKTAQLFEKMKILNIQDLLKLYPRNYLRYEEPIDIALAQVGERVAIRASIQSEVSIKKVRNLKIVSCVVKDGSGSVKLTWFNSPFLKQFFRIGQSFVFVGTLSAKGAQLTMEHPEYYKIEQYNMRKASLQPVYPLTEGLSNKLVTKAVTGALEVLDELPDNIPLQVREKFQLLPLKQAILGVHFPDSWDAMLECRNRLVFDEFFSFLVKMRQMRQHRIKEENHFDIHDFSSVRRFLEQLPFSLTEGQKKAVSEIQSDLSGMTVMNRLIQGDVGSGKTVIAEIAMLAVVSNGYQAALMAPTEVLAMQHYEGINKDLESYGVCVALLCGSTKPAEKRKIYERLQSGEIDIVIGTHALIQECVIYNNLALVVTDEQHRFGVRQRERLSHKGEQPHVLVMSATPIPRTLAIIMYGDLDISVIKDVPACRKPIKNCVVGPKYRPTAYKFMFGQIQEGHQIYIICPMVEASENVEAENVIEYREMLLEYFPSSVNIAYLHGKMSPDEKNDIMSRFANKEIDILVSTTVIEVGINNPNATVMMIENAEKFGLAQLHQLRGRVGRGDAQSYCIMLCASDKKEALERLEILNQSNDGFYIANEDLKMRGPGDFFGVRQSGDMIFQLGDIYSHAEILKQANEAIQFLEKQQYSFETIREQESVVL